MAGKIGQLFSIVFLTQVFGCLDSMGVLLSPCHKCILALYIHGKLPVVFVTLPLIQQVVVIFCMYPFCEIAGGSNYILSLQLSLNNPSLGDTGTSIFTQRAPWRDPFKITENGMDSVSLFSLVNRFVSSVGIKQVPHMQ